MTIIVITLVAVVMGMSAVAPAITVAYGDHNQGHEKACEQLAASLRHIEDPFLVITILFRAGC